MSKARRQVGACCAEVRPNASSDDSCQPAELLSERLTDGLVGASVTQACTGTPPLTADVERIAENASGALYSPPPRLVNTARPPAVVTAQSWSPSWSQSTQTNSRIGDGNTQAKRGNNSPAASRSASNTLLSGPRPAIRTEVPSRAAVSNVAPIHLAFSFVVKLQPPFAPRLNSPTYVPVVVVTSRTSGSTTPRPARPGPSEIVGAPPASGRRWNATMPVTFVTPWI